MSKSAELHTCLLSIHPLQSSAVSTSHLFGLPGRFDSQLTGRTKLGQICRENGFKLFGIGCKRHS